MRPRLPSDPFPAPVAESAADGAGLKQRRAAYPPDLSLMAKARGERSRTTCIALLTGYQEAPG